MSSPIEKYIDDPIEDTSSIQQERVLEEELESQELLNELKSVEVAEEVLPSQEVISNVSFIEDYLAKSAPDSDEFLSVESINNLLEKGASEEELMEFLNKAITSVNAMIARDKTKAKKYLEDLQEVMAVLEKTLSRQTTTNPELQGRLKQVQNNIGNLLKENNPEKMQAFLKNNELKIALEKGIKQAAKTPDVLKSFAENSKNLAQQNAQKGDVIKQNSASQLLDKLMDKSRAFLGINKEAATREVIPQQAKIPQVQPRESAMMLATRDFNRQAVQTQPQQNLIASKVAVMTQIPQELRVTSVNNAQVQTKAVAQQTEVAVERKVEAKPVEEKQSTEQKVKIEPVNKEPAKEATKEQAKTEEKPPTKCGGGTNCHCPKSTAAPDVQKIETTKALPPEVQKEVMQTMAKNSEQLTMQAAESNKTQASSANSLLQQLKAGGQSR